jgi:hypothetical protein
MVNTASTLKNSDIDGLVFWRDVKRDFVRYDDSTPNATYRINKICVRKINFMFQYEQLANKDKKGETILPDHFIYQLVNIPTTEPVNVRKVMQLALNIGQWKAADKNTGALIEADNIFKKYKLDKIDSYLAKSEIAILSHLFP